MPKRKVSAETELWRAARKGDLEKVQDLLANGANIHAWNDIALGKAAWRGRLDVVRHLLEREGEKADLHASNDYAVRMAALGNRWDVVKYLVEKGADVAADGHLVWYRSALHGDPGTVKCLLEHGVDVHFKNDWALEVAATNGRPEIVVVLVEWIFREEAWEGRLPMDVHREGERLGAILENSVSLDDCEGHPLAARAMAGAGAAVAVIMDRSAAAAERLRGPGD